MFAAPNDQFATGGHSFDGVFTANFYDSLNGSWISAITSNGAAAVAEDSLPPSNDVYTTAAIQACPLCVEIAGWDGNLYWFSHSDYYRGEMQLVSQMGRLFTFPVAYNSDIIPAQRPQIVNGKLFILMYRTLSCYSLVDGSLESSSTSLLFSYVIVSPDHTRALVQRQFSWSNAPSTYVLEVNITDGAVLDVHQLDDDLLIESSVGDKFWVAKSTTSSEFKLFSWDL